MLKRLAKNRNIRIAGLAIFVILFTVIFTSGHSDSEQPVPATAVVEKGDLPVYMVEAGEIEAVYSSNIKAPMEWRMELQIIDMAEEGKFVEKGDFLLRFDTSTLEDQLDLAKDKLASALADREKLLAQQASEMKQLEIEYDMAGYSREIAELQVELLKYEADVQRQDAELDRKKTLVQLQEAKTNIESQRIIHQSQLNNTELRIMKARADLEELKKKIKSLTIYSPRDGMVVYNRIGGWNSRHKATIGDKARPGETVIQIPDLKTMQVNLVVNEMDALQLSVDQNAIVRLDAYPETAFTGKVVEIAKLAQTEHEETVKFFQVLVRIEQSDPVLKPGMTAKAKIHLQTIKNALYVPVTSLFEKNGQPVVFHRHDLETPVAVITGKRNDQYVQIISGDIAQGDELATFMPDYPCKRYGYQRFANDVYKRPDYFRTAFDSMQQQGLVFDYDQMRSKPVASGSDSVSEKVEVEKFRGRLKNMSLEERNANRKMNTLPKDKRKSEQARPDSATIKTKRNVDQ